MGWDSLPVVMACCSAGFESPCRRPSCDRNCRSIDPKAGRDTRTPRHPAAAHGADAMETDEPEKTCAAKALTPFPETSTTCRSLDRLVEAAVELGADEGRGRQAWNAYPRVVASGQRGPKVGSDEQCARRRLCADVERAALSERLSERPTHDDPAARTRSHSDRRRRQRTLRRHGLRGARLFRGASPPTH